MKKILVAAAGVAAVFSAGSVAYAVVPSEAGPTIESDAPILVPDDPAQMIEADIVDPVLPEPEPTAKVEPTPVPTARPEPTPVPTVQPTVEPTPEPTVGVPGIGAVTLQGDVSVNGTGFVEDVLFGVIWDQDDPVHVQLWALWNNEPVLVCDGRVYEPAGEPVYQANSQLLGPAGRCHGQNVPNDGEGVALYIVFEDGQWASAILISPPGVPPVEILAR